MSISEMLKEAKNELKGKSASEDNSNNDIKKDMEEIKSELKNSEDKDNAEIKELEQNLKEMNEDSETGSQEAEEDSGTEKFVHERSFEKHQDLDISDNFEDEELDTQNKTESLEGEGMDSKLEDLSATDEESSFNDGNSSHLDDLQTDAEIDKEDFEEPEGKKDEVKQNTDSEADEDVMEHIAEAESQNQSDTTLESLNQRISDLESKFVSNDSEELGKIAELEKRVERVELEEDQTSIDRGELVDRIERLEDQMETDTPQILDDRLTELEDVVMNPDKHIEKLLNNGLKQRVQEEDEKIQGFEEKIEQQNKKIEKLESKFEEMKKDADNTIEEESNQLRAELKEMLDEELDNSEALTVDQVEELIEAKAEEIRRDEQRIDELWEAMDEEVSMLERKIHDNQQANEELMDNVVQLSEMIKTALNR